MKTPDKIAIIITVIALTVLAAAAVSAPLSHEAREKLIANGGLESFIQILKEAKMHGYDEPGQLYRNSKKLSASADTLDSMKVLVLMVDFSDNPQNGGGVSGTTPATFDSILFSRGENPTGSFTEYYLENSYGNLLIQGEIHGWYRMPQPYSYYVNNQVGTGSFPYNSQSLVLHAIDSADADGVDFSQFDLYGPDGSPDGEIDGLMIIFSGPGAELTGDTTDMISHKYHLNSYATYVDGVSINLYNVQPEEYSTLGRVSPIGVFCHEFGHILGLPDLYDVDYTPETSEGLGEWSLMATGTYKNASRTPSHLDAWSKVYLGFVQPTVVYDNMIDVEFPQVETNPVIYQLYITDAFAIEYFLVENRQRVGFDEGLAGTGLIIYHVDESATWNNQNVDRYHVAVEQADGFRQLEYTSNNEGDAGDPWPGSSNKRSFDDLSNPNSRAYGGAITQVSVWNISDSDSLMTANLDIDWSRPNFDLMNYAFEDPNANGILEPGETIEFYFNMRNHWMTANNVTITMTSNDQSITFIDNVVNKSIIYGDGEIADNLFDPIIFTLPDTLTPTFDSFYINVESDGGLFTAQFALEQQIGSAQILIVDDDRGADYDSIYVNDLYLKLIPSDVWEKNSLGTPPPVILKKYDMVFWFTGDTTPNLLNSTDITAMESYLDYGGNLFLTGQGIAGELHSEDSAFLEDYLHAQYGGLLFSPSQLGIEGSPIGDGYKIRYFSGANQEYTKAEQITAVGGAIPAFEYQYYSGVTSLSFSGSYKLVFFNWGYEAIDDNISSKYANRDSILTRVLNFFGRTTTDVSDVKGGTLLPKSFVLEQNYPNPFNPTTTIQYTVKNSGGGAARTTVLKVYNIMGQEVRTLVDEVQIPGRYSVEWDGADKYGSQVASGMYFYRLTRGNDKEARKMVLLK